MTTCTPSIEMWGLIEKALYQKRMRKKDLAKRSGFHVNTIAQDAKCPAHIPIGRLWVYFDILDIPVSNVLATVSAEISGKEE